MQTLEFSLVAAPATALNLMSCANSRDIREPLTKMTKPPHLRSRLELQIIDSLMSYATKERRVSCSRLMMKRPTKVGEVDKQKGHASPSVRVFVCTCDAIHPRTRDDNLRNHFTEKGGKHVGHSAKAVKCVRLLE